MPASWRGGRRRIILGVVVAIGMPVIADAVDSRWASPAIDCLALSSEAPPVRRLPDVPPAIASALAMRMSHGREAELSPLMAARDEPWQVTDVVIGKLLPFRRFIEAGHAGSRWYVWYESGGIAHAYHAAIFDLPAGASVPSVVAHFFERPEGLCAATTTVWQAPGPGTTEPDQDFW